MYTYTGRQQVRCRRRYTRHLDDILRSRAGPDAIATRAGQCRWYIFFKQNPPHIQYIVNLDAISILHLEKAPGAWYSTLAVAR